jgi:valyl-tRNA synthetase
MPHDLPKAYDPTAIEDHWAEYWVREDLFAQPTPAPGSDAQAEQFSILLPPPNVTGRLHMGHMLNQTEMDILTRWRRMSGRLALWLPGTDHAGIATQMMVERQLTEEGTTRQQLGREAFVERVWEWKRHYGGAILSQMKRLGASVDWQREYFTMDENLSVAVREAFVRLHEQGLIYRGAYIVNWCPRCQTAISDLEVVHEEQKGHIWEIRYPVLNDQGEDSGEFLTVATTRPETMLGDTAVAIHPEDERYLHLHGKKLRLPLVGRDIPIILDAWVSREFGTGAVKVTPAHDPNDFALGQRHNLPNINIMDETAHINNEGGNYKGLDRYVARKRIVADLEELELLAGVKDHVNNIGHCDRCKTVVEPRLSTQWFVAVNKEPIGGGDTLAGKARAAVKADAEGHKAIRFTPEQYEKTYLNWMENIYDWCISRQLWWGHRIPAWHCATCGKISVARVDPTACAHCNSTEIKQETDVLDTWFSSGLLPFTVFGWPATDESQAAETIHGNLLTLEPRTSNLTPDLAAFYPTTQLVTGFDILFFWVARMIMLGCHFMLEVPMPDGSARPLAESVPFRNVYIHALIRDANREKMSKTKGNVVDPIDIIQRFGTDAVRFTLASMASPGTDIAFSEARTEGYRAFANKIWNAARFLFMNLDRARAAAIEVELPKLGAPHLASEMWDGAPPNSLPTTDTFEARWILARLSQTAAAANAALAEYRFDEAANAIYQFFWGDLCDWYLEIVKLRLNFAPGDDLLLPTTERTEESLAETRAALATLVAVFEASLRLLSPFMPFITEEIWHALYAGLPPSKSIALARYPQAADFPCDQAAVREMELLQELIVTIRALRKDLGVPEKESAPIRLHAASGFLFQLEWSEEILARLARVSGIEISDSDAAIAGNNARSTANFDVAVIYEKHVDVAAERERLGKELAKHEKNLAANQARLADPKFAEKAPAHIVDGLRKQTDETRILYDKAKAALDALPTE